MVCRSYNVEEEVLTTTRRGITNEARNVAIYLVRNLRGDSLEQISKEFKMSNYSSVSSVIERMKALILKDRKLKRRVEILKKEISMGQEQT